MPLHARGILALLVVTIVWGTTFPAMKDMTDNLSANWIVVSRFAIAGVLLSPFLLRAKWRDLHYGFLAGVLLFFCYLTQVEGLSLTSSNRNAFICGLNVLVVPLLGIAMGMAGQAHRAGPDPGGGRPVCPVLGGQLYLDPRRFAGAGGGLPVRPLHQGDGAVLAQGRAPDDLDRGPDLDRALFAGLWILLREVPRGVIDVPHDASDYYTYIWQGLVAYKWNLIYLGVIATAAIISLQTWGQSHATANEAAVIYAFEPASAAIFGYFWLGETMGVMQLLGAVLLISGMIVSQWNTPERPASALVPE